MFKEVVNMNNLKFVAVLGGPPGDKLRVERFCSVPTWVVIGQGMPPNVYYQAPSLPGLARSCDSPCIIV